LIGLVAYDLVGSDDLAQPGLFSTPSRRRQLEVAVDRLAERFGINVVKRAMTSLNPKECDWGRTLIT
jgi:hypothetical protein